MAITFPVTPETRAAKAPVVSQDNTRAFASNPGIRGTGLLLLFLVLASFAISLRVEMLFDSRQVFVKPDVLFNSDPDIMQRAFSVGWAAPRLKHPNLSNFVAPPVRVAARLLNFASRGKYDEQMLRDKMSLLVVPMFGAARTGVLFSLAFLLGLGLWGATAICLLDMVCASRIVFGSMPESFPLSGFALACLFWLAVSALKPAGRLRLPLWILCGVFATGVTLTNLVPFGILLFAVYLTLTGALFPAIWRTGTAVMMVVVFSFALWLSFYTAIHLTLGSEIDQVSRASATAGDANSSDTGRSLVGIVASEQKFLHGRPLQKILHFPLALADTFAPPATPRAVPYHAPVPTSGGPGIMFTYENAQRSLPFFLLGIAAIALMSAGAWSYINSERWRPMALGCIGILLFNILLHAVYGDELFLYSQHWQVVCVVLMAGLLLNRQASQAARAVLASFIALVAMNSFLLVRSILRALENSLA